MSVYVIRAGNLDLYKVGVAADPHRRLAELQTGSPFHLELVATIEGAREDEKRIHAALHASRARGEWFELPAPPSADDLLAWAAFSPPARSCGPIDLSDADPVGAVEIAERLGVSRRTVDQWRQRNLGFPEPRWRVGGRPAWNFDDVQAWFKARDSR